MWRDLSVAVVALTIASGLTVRQSAATGAIAGSVVDASGQPFSGAAVKVSDPRRGVEASVTSSDGRFQFSNISVGRYTLTASADGYIPAQYGAFQPGDPGVPVLAVAGQKISNLIITLRRGGAISGQLIDDRGEPAAGHVSILVPGPPGMKTVTAGPTDRDGRYRFGNLAPGVYAVLAVPEAAHGERRVRDASGNEHIATLTPTFYPSATTFAGASLVTIGGDEEAQGTDIRVRTEPAAPVVLSLSAAGGKLPGPVQAVLIADAERGPASMQWAQDPDASGKATIAGVIAGQYRLVVSGSGAAVQEWAVRHVSVDGLIPTAVPVLLERGATLECRTTFEGEPPPDRLPSSGTPNQPRQAVSGSVPLRLNAVDTDLPKVLERGPDVLSLAGPATIVRGILPGLYVLRITDADGPKMRSLKQAGINGADVLDLPVELRGGETAVVSLTVTDRPSEVSGAISGADGRPRLDVAVVIFPRDSRYWLRGSRRILVTRPDTSGAYEFRGLPGGEYLVATIRERPPDDVSDAQWLNGLASAAAHLTIVDGQHHVQDLRVR